MTESYIDPDCVPDIETTDIADIPESPDLLDVQDDDADRG